MDEPRLAGPTLTFEPPFEVIEPPRCAAPLVFYSPHSGDAIRARFSPPRGSTR